MLENCRAYEEGCRLCCRPPVLSPPVATLTSQWVEGQAIQGPAAQLTTDRSAPALATAARSPTGVRRCELRKPRDLAHWSGRHTGDNPAELDIAGDNGAFGEQSAAGRAPHPFRAG